MHGNDNGELSNTHGAKTLAYLTFCYCCCLFCLKLAHQLTGLQCHACEYIRVYKQSLSGAVAYLHFHFCYTGSVTCIDLCKLPA